MIKRLLSGTQYTDTSTDKSITRCAVLDFGHLLNTSERRNNWYTWTQFAEFILEAYDNDRARGIAKYLKHSEA
jgi:hypothetical protein